MDDVDVDDVDVDDVDVDDVDVDDVDECMSEAVHELPTFNPWSNGHSDSSPS